MDINSLFLSQYLECFLEKYLKKKNIAMNITQKLLVDFYVNDNRTKAVENSLVILSLSVQDRKTKCVHRGTRGEKESTKAQNL